MKIYIHSHLFNDDSAWRDLDRLFFFIEDRRYEWLIRNEQDLDDFEKSTYLDAQPKYKYDIYSELAQSSFSKYNTEGYTPNIIIIDINSLDSLKYYIRFLEQKLYIIIEHIENDKYFLNALFRCYKKTSKKIIRHIENKWIDFIGAAGKDGVMPNIRARLGEIEPRIFVLLDSDKKLPNEPLNKVSQSVVEFCESKKDTCYCHITYKREIENYLPESVLSTLTSVEQKTVYESYCKLSSHQKDFYDLEKGFDDKSTALEQETLFETVFDFQNLRKGFALNNKFDTKKDFPRLFANTQHVTQDTLNARCAHQPQPNELKELLNSISRLI